MKLEAELIMKLHVLLATPPHVGGGAGDDLLIIPIVGGSFEGPKLRGTVCPGGADWNTRISPTTSHAAARYWICTEDGVYISVENEGIIEDGPSRIKTVPHFKVQPGKGYDFLRSGVFVGELEGGAEPDSVDITFYKLQ